MAELSGDPRDAMLELAVNDEQRQRGTTADIIHQIIPLIAYMSRFFTLKAGDVVLTGTPAGVGPLDSGDELTISFRGQTLTVRVLQSLLTAFSGSKTYINVLDQL